MIALHVIMAGGSWWIAKQYVSRRDGFALLMCILAGISFGANVVEVLKLVNP